MVLHSFGKSKLFRAREISSSRFLAVEAVDWWEDAIVAPRNFVAPLDIDFVQPSMSSIQWIFFPLKTRVTQLSGRTMRSISIVCCSMSVVSQLHVVSSVVLTRYLIDDHTCWQIATISLVKGASTTATQMLGLNFTLKLWAESLCSWVSCMTITWNKLNYCAWVCTIFE